MRALSTRAERTIAARPRDVWAYRLDFLNLPRYNPNVSGIERSAEAGPDGSGAVYRFELATPRGTQPVELRVTGSVPGELVAIELSGGLPAEERFTVSAGADQATCVAAIELTLHAPDSVPEAEDEALVRSAAAQIDDELARMQVLLEAKS